MKNRFKIVTLLLLGISSVMLAFSAVAAENESVDADAAITLARSEHCLRCHAVDKKKEGSSYASVAKAYKKNKNAEDLLFEHVTTAPKVKLSDGHKENHKAILDKSPEQIRNLVRWILAQ